MVVLPLHCNENLLPGIFNLLTKKGSIMNAEIYAKWLKRQGHQVIRTESSYWYDAGPRVLQAFPYHWTIQPSEQELQELILNHGIISLRYSTKLKSTEGMVSYHVVLSPPYDMDVLKTKVRNRLRKGLRECQVDKIPFERLAGEGWALQRETLERQGRTGSMSQLEWKRLCLSARDLKGFEAWGALVDGRLVASILTCRIDDICYIPLAQSLRKYQKLYANNALFYIACRDMLTHEGVSGIFGNLHSLDAPESVSEFKLHIGFTAKPVRQRVVFHPKAMPFIYTTTHAVIAGLQKWGLNGHILGKVEGMLRFHLQGQLPLSEQEWPGCLVHQRKELLTKLHQLDG